jgi:ABC-type nickel/cobalt efflux system permease component RcnA
MNLGPQVLLIAAVAAVGVLHTIVPDHWMPITLIARQRGWSRAETARASLQAGVGHVVSTLIIAAVVWLAGVAVAQRFGHIVDTASSIALVAFGLWFAISAWRDLHSHRGHGHAHDAAHLHGHDHAGHTHDHGPVTAAIAITPPEHDHHHKSTTRTALLLILGSSPMVEGIPAFFAAGKYGPGLIIIMAVVFALSTIATYALLSVYSTAGLQRARLGAFERYGEVLSGAFIALVGLAFWIWPVL